MDTGGSQKDIAAYSIKLSKLSIICTLCSGYKTPHSRDKVV